jgi:hypothetical protein
MIGAIAGDIMGSVYEFRPIKTKDFPLFSPFCDFTDDTDIRPSYSFDESCGQSPTRSLRSWTLPRMKTPSAMRSPRR